MGLFLLDYGAGNVQSLANTLQTLGHSFKWITSPSDFDDATVSLQLVSFNPSLYVYPEDRRSALSFRELEPSRPL
jgi:hypothetical protein